MAERIPTVKYLPPRRIRTRRSRGRSNPGRVSSLQEETMIDVCLLGTAGTIPLPNRQLSAALVRVGGSLVLLDCGEGTQVALRKRGWGLRRLRAILVTHAHADHVLGLPGLLLSLGFSGKGADEPLTVYGPPPLEDVLRRLLVVAPRLPYPLHIVTLSGS